MSLWSVPLYVDTPVLSQRINTRRQRFIHLCVRSTTHRRVLKPASCLSALASPRGRGGGRCTQPRPATPAPRRRPCPWTCPGALPAAARAREGETRDGLASHLEIIALDALDCQTEGHAAALGQHAALGATLAAIGGVLAHLFPPQGALWS